MGGSPTSSKSQRLSFKGLGAKVAARMLPDGMKSLAPSGVADNLYDNYLQPACKALGLGAVRFHDLRHSFATMNLSAGEHYMQVSKWLGHSSFVLTLTTPTPTTSTRTKWLCRRLVAAWQTWRAGGS